MHKDDWKQKILNASKIFLIILLIMPLLFCIGLYIKKYNNTVENIFIQCEDKHPDYIRVYYDHDAGFSDIQSRYYFFSYTGKTVVNARHIKNSKALRIELHSKAKKDDLLEYRMKIYYKGKQYNPHFLENAIFYNAEVTFLEDHTIVLKYEPKEEQSNFKNIVFDYKIDVIKNYMLSNKISWYQYKYIIANYKKYFLLLGMSIFLFLLCFSSIRKFLIYMALKVSKFLMYMAGTCLKVNNAICSFFTWLISLLPDREVKIPPIYKIILEIIILFFIEFYFFRKFMFYQECMYDLGDGRLNMLFMEHWFSVFRGFETWNTMSFFYPMHNTISYSDLMIFPALPYSFFRFLGCDMYFACHYSYIVVHTLGTVVLYYFLSRQWNCSKIWSMIGVIIFSCSNAYQIKIGGHCQFITISILPCLLLFLYLYIKHNKSKKRILFALLVCLFYALLAYSSYYVVFFFTFYCLCFIVILGIYFFCRNYIYLFIVIYHHLIEFFAYGITTIILLILFFITYLPSAKLFGKRNWGYVMLLAPRWFDFFNVGRDNFLEGKFWNLSYFNSRYASAELSMGIPIIICICFFIFMIQLYKSIKKNRTCKITENHIVFFIGISIIFSYLFCCKIGNYSLWRIIYNYVPGASSIRAIARYGFFLYLPVALVIAYKGSKNFGKNTIRDIVVSIVILILVSINSIHFIPLNNTPLKKESQRMLTICPPPKDCKVFFVKGKLLNFPSYFINLEAMEIASHFHINTINGYSGQFPPHWNLWTQNSEKYYQAVFDWMKLHNMQSIYSYDLDNNIWTYHSINNIIAN